MSYSLKNRPELTVGIIPLDLLDRPKETLKLTLEENQNFIDWLESFEKKFRDLLRVQRLQVWIEHNSHTDITLEELMRIFIEKEILGE